MERFLELPHGTDNFNRNRSLEPDKDWLTVSVMGVCPVYKSATAIHAC